MSDAKGTLPPPTRRDRDVAGFSATPRDADTSENSDVVDLHDTPLALPPHTLPTQLAQEQAPEREIRRRLNASVTPPTKEQLTESARSRQASYSDVLIDAWLNYADALEREHQPDDQLERRQTLGVRRARYKRPRPSGRSGIQFYLTEREMTAIEESATAAGYENRSAYIEELLLRELGVSEHTTEPTKKQ